MLGKMRRITIQRPRALAGPVVMMLGTAALAFWMADRCRAVESDREIGSLTPIRDLPTQATEAKRGSESVRIRGVVTWRSEIDGLWALVVQDATAGVWVNLGQAYSDGVWRGGPISSADLPPGMEVEIEGNAVPGGYKTSLVPQTITRLGMQPIPAAASCNHDTLFGGLEDCLRVGVDVVVQEARRARGEWRLIVAYGDERCLATMPCRTDTEDLEALVDAEVRITGVAVSFFNQRGEFLAPRILLTDRADIQLQKPPPARPFDAVRVPLDAIARYRPNLRDGHRVVTEGTVIYSIPGRFFFIQDGAIGVRVQTRDPDALMVGERVEVAGFLDMTQPVAGLAGAVCRRTGHAPPPQPIPIEPESIVALNNEASFYGKLAKPGDFHGCLATFLALLVEVREVTDGGLMMLAVGKTTVAAWCSPEDFGPLRKLLPGSEVRVTGVVVHERVKPADGIESLAWPLVDRLRVLVRSPADIVVVRAPSWWTPRRLALALAAVAGVAGLAILWAITLRRQVKRQMAVIEGQVQREAAMEERRRIASEFHDTLEQDLAGVALRLDVASGRTDDSSARAVLEQQRGLIDRIRTETREFLWDLRDPSRRDGSLAESLQAQVAYMQSFTTVPLRLRCEGITPRVSPLIQHHLLRLVREAVSNALKHGAPAEVGIRLATDHAAAIVEVADNGTGFDVEARGSVVGHFGIRGMRERARRIGGAIEIQSTPPHGTRVVVHVPREADQQ